MQLALIVSLIVVVVSGLLAWAGYLIDRIEDRFEVGGDTRDGVDR